jgi:hypothetical protein
MKAGRSRRWTLAAAVAVFVVGLLAGRGTASPSPPGSRPVELRVIQRLRAGEAAESLALRIQGRMVGTLAVDRRHPTATLTVLLSSPGRYRYALSSTATFEVNGERYKVSGQGGGGVEVGGGRSAFVTGDRRHRVPDTVLASF